MADFTQLLSQFLYGRLALIGGSGGSASGVLSVNITSTGTIANTSETALYSYAMPANTLGVDGRGVRITAWGTVAANANTKTIQLYFGSTVISSVSAGLNNTNWRFVADVLRTGAATQTADGVLVYNGSTNGLTISAPTEDTTAAITIKVTGTNGTASANDIVIKGAIVELLN